MHGADVDEGRDRLGGATLFADGGRVEDPTWDQVRAVASSDHVAWLDCEAPGEEDLRRLAEVFDFHDEMIRDSASFGQRTRLVEYDGYLVFVVSGVADELTGDLTEVHLYLTGHRVVSVREGPCPPLEAVARHPSRVTNAHGTVIDLMSRLLSALVGSFTPALEQIDAELNDLETAILERPSPEDLRRLLELRARVNSYRRVVDPARDMVGLGRFAVFDALEETSGEARRQLRDLAMDLAFVGDQVEVERDRLTTAMDIYINKVGIRQNDTMQKLAAVSTLFLPLTFITGFFGMNFFYMTDQLIDRPVAFMAFGIGLNVAIAVVALWVMRRRGWFHTPDTD